MSKKTVIRVVNSTTHTYEIEEKYRNAAGESTATFTLDPEVRIEDARLSDGGRFSVRVRTAYDAIRIRERPDRGAIQAKSDWLGTVTTQTKLRHKAILWAQQELLDRRAKRVNKQLESDAATRASAREEGTNPTHAQLPRLFIDNGCANLGTKKVSRKEKESYLRVLRMMAMLFSDQPCDELEWSDYLHFFDVRVGREGLFDTSGKRVKSQADELEARGRKPTLRDEQTVAIYRKDGTWVKAPAPGLLPADWKGPVYDSNRNSLKKDRNRKDQQTFYGSGYTMILPEHMAAPRARRFVPVSMAQPARDWTTLSAAYTRLLNRKVITENFIKKVIASAPRGDFDSNIRGEGYVASENRFRAVLDSCDAVDPSGRLRYMLVKAWKHGHRIGTIRHLAMAEVARTHGQVKAMILDMGPVTAKGDESIPESAADLWRRAHYVPGEKNKEGYNRLIPVDDALGAEEDRYLEKRPADWNDGEWVFPSSFDPSRPISEDEANDLLIAAEEHARFRIESLGGDPDMIVPIVLGELWHPYRRKWENVREGLGYIQNKSSAYVGLWTTDVGNVQHSVYGRVHPALCLAAVEGISLAAAVKKYHISDTAEREAEIERSDWRLEDIVRTQAHREAA